MLVVAALGILGLTGLGAFFGYKKDEDAKNAPPPRVKSNLVTASQAVAVSTGPAPGVSLDKLQVLKALVAKIITLTPVTEAERANGVNTAIAAGFPALAAALRSGSALDVAKAAAGL